MRISDWSSDVCSSDLDHGYHVVSGSAGPTGGIMAIPADAAAHGMRPWWGGYVGSPDVDADAKRLAEAGGSGERATEGIGRASWRERACPSVDLGVRGIVKIYINTNCFVLQHTE